LIYIDLIVIVVLLYAFLKGFSNGLVNELASFLGLLIGAIISYSFSDDLSKIIDDYVEIDGQILNILSFILLFILTSFLFTIAGKYMTKLIKYISLGTINRLLGGIFSSLKFLIIIVSISMVINYFSELLAIEIIPSDQKNKSTVYPILISIGDLLLEVLNNKSLTI
jgi:membrane protein required for colicin V production|tara:strand:- start:984 stop:1484 length:501 start_codon:yes stop_codon:yes gene_type:complete